MAIMNNDDPRYQKVIICGPFGGGKSILLTQKAIQLNEQPEYKGKVMFVVHKADQNISPMQFHRLKIDLKENRAIFVEEYDSYGILHSEVVSTL